MEYRKLGSSGLSISAISLGGWINFGGHVDDSAVGAILRSAVERGINFIDLADVYARGEAELTVGRLLPEYRRSDLVLSSKCFWPMSENPNDRGLSRKHIVESVDASLARLGSDYLDIMFCHREDPETPLEEVCRAMDDLVSQGKILYWGTSVWRAATLARAHGVAERRHQVAPRVEQPCYNLIDRHIESEVLPAARELGMGVVCWSPLAGGILTGKYVSGVPDKSRGETTSWLEQQLADAELMQRVGRFCALAGKLGCRPGQLALAWLLAQPGITSVITGASRVEQLVENLGALEVDVTSELAAELDELFPGPAPAQG